MQEDDRTMAQQPERVIQVRKASKVHATVKQSELGGCSSASQFRLDDGAEERGWQLTEDDADAIQDLLEQRVRAAHQ